MAFSLEAEAIVSDFDPTWASLLRFLTFSLLRNRLSLQISSQFHTFRSTFVIGVLKPGHYDPHAHP